MANSSMLENVIIIQHQVASEYPFVGATDPYPLLPTQDPHAPHTSNPTTTTHPHPLTHTTNTPPTPR